MTNSSYFFFRSTAAFLASHARVTLSWTTSDHSATQIENLHETINQRKADISDTAKEIENLRKEKADKQQILDGVNDQIANIEEQLANIETESLSLSDELNAVLSATGTGSVMKPFRARLILNTAMEDGMGILTPSGATLTLRIYFLHGAR